MSRQVFFCSMGGYDTHSGQIAAHATLYQQVSQAASAFYNATVEMGIPDRCLLFTASDFGRTLAQNGGGTDHGWGAHHLVVGGALKYGGTIAGTFPPVTFSNSATPNPQDIGQGRLLPTTSIDQYAATFAMWFGVAPTDLPTVFPNLPAFTSQGWVLPLL